MLVVERILCVIIGYGFGLLQTGYLVGKMNNVDIRKAGSGNAGSTNALRTMGLKAGMLTFAGDFFKGVLVVLLVKFLFGTGNPDMKMVFSLYAALGAVLGHNFPFYLQFRGGKGVATTAGAIIACDWRLAIIPFIVFVSVTVLTKYVSAASITMVLEFLAEVILLGQRGALDVSRAFQVEIYVLVAILVLMCIIRHRTNIVRLLDGKENKIK